MALFAAAGSAAGAADPVVPPVAARSLGDWYRLGGAIMHALSACSVIAVALIFERMWQLRRAAVAPRRLERAAREAAATGERAVLAELVGDGRSALARLVRAGLDALDPIERATSQGGLEADRLRRNLPLLAAIGNLATMLGLLGTVLGMIEAFELIASAGVGDARIVAGGIFRALVTTAAGLTVGIGALAAHALLARRADDQISLLEELGAQLFEGEPAAPMSDASDDIGARARLAS